MISMMEKKILALLWIACGLSFGLGHQCVRLLSNGQLVYYCCDNYEDINGICVECGFGYMSYYGERCTECADGTYGRKCRYICKCHESERCDHIVGCVNTTKSTALQIHMTEQTVINNKQTTVPRVKQNYFFYQVFPNTDKCVPVNWLLLSGVSAGLILIMIISHVICCLRRNKRHEVLLPTEDYNEIGTMHYHNIRIEQSPEVVRNVIAMPIYDEPSLGRSTDSDRQSVVFQTRKEDINYSGGDGLSYYPLSRSGGEHHYYRRCILPDEQTDTREKNDQMKGVQEYVNLKF